MGIDAGALLMAMKPAVDAALSGTPGAARIVLRIAGGELIDIKVDEMDVWADTAMDAMRRLVKAKLALEAARIDAREMAVNEAERQYRALGETRERIQDARDALDDALSGWPE